MYRCVCIANKTFLIVEKYNVQRNLTWVYCEAACFCHVCDEFSGRCYVNKRDGATQVLEPLFAQGTPDL